MTATELLIEAMERFAAAEPQALLLVWTDEKDNVNMRSNAIGCTHVIGLAEYAKQNALRGIFKG